MSGTRLKFCAIFRVSQSTWFARRRPTGRWGLRDYGTGTWEGGDAECGHKAGANRDNRPRNGLTGGTATVEASTIYRETCGKCGACRVDDQLGLEETPALYVEKMVEVFREARRVLRSDGTLWLVLGDSYNAAGREGHGTRVGAKQGTNRASAAGIDTNRPTAPDLKPKDLCMIPAQVALALRTDGWYLRKEIIWAKGVSFCETYSGSCMPESARDRPTSAHEKIYLLTKSASYFYDADGEREDAAWERWGDQTYSDQAAQIYGQRIKASSKAEVERVAARRAVAWNVRAVGLPGENGSRGRAGQEVALRGKRNLRDVWAINPEPYAQAHFAVFPSRIPEAAIRLGTSERGCCPECDAPWERETETTYRRHENWFGAKQDARHDRGAQGAAYNEPVARETTGWRPTCECFGWLYRWTELNENGKKTQRDVYVWPNPADEERVAAILTRAICLDPFAGSGTTSLVARRLGRRSIGIDLSEKYVRLALERLSLPDETGAVPSANGGGHAQMSLLGKTAE